MPKKIEHWLCNICNQSHSTLDSAERCEARGTPPLYPIGCVFMEKDDGFYKDICFAVAKNNPRGHYNSLSLWACRKRNGDSLGADLCGSNNAQRLCKWDGYCKKDSPEFKRMVAWLQNQNINVTVWDGEKPIPLYDWLKSVDK